MDAWTLGILVVLVVVLLVDGILSWKGKRAHFSNGLPIFRQVLSAGSPKPKLPSALRMASGVPASLFSRLRFQQLDGETLGFDEAFSEGPSGLRGTLRFDLAGARVEVAGFLDWSVPLVLVIVGIKSFEFHEPLILVIFAGVGLLLYLHKIQRCRQVATYALREWNA